MALSDTLNQILYSMGEQTQPLDCGVKLLVFNMHTYASRNRETLSCYGLSRTSSTFSSGARRRRMQTLRTSSMRFFRSGSSASNSSGVSHSSSGMLLACGLHQHVACPSLFATIYSKAVDAG